MIRLGNWWGRGAAAARSRSAPPVTAEARLCLFAHGEAMEKQLGTAPIYLDDLPFIIGRAPHQGERTPAAVPSLVLRDEKPYRLSRAHFAILQETDGSYVVHDLGSTLGTVVNGEPIGHHERRKSAVLAPGDNRVTAGSADSPFAFAIIVPSSAEAEPD